MWECCETRKQVFRFENGVLVRAQDQFRAIELLKSISLKDSSEVVHMGQNIWSVKFHKNVFTEIELPDPTSARRAAEWRLYLDRRAPRLVGLVMEKETPPGRWRYLLQIWEPRTPT